VLFRSRTVSPAILDRAESVARPLAGLGFKPALETLGTIALARPGLELLLGRPTDFGMASTAWRLPADRPDAGGSPLDRGVGLFWLAPVCPATGRDVRAVVEILREGLGAAGYDALLTVTLLNGRAAGVTAALSYDREDPEDAERARACKDEVLDRLIAEGYPPYRVGIGDMDRLDPESSGYWEMVRRLKDAVDPDGLLAPGRYAPWQAGAATARADGQS
jgi:4-cresol dehydrogenase (hydroxylating)